MLCSLHKHVGGAVLPHGSHEKGLCGGWLHHMMLISKTGRQAVTRIVVLFSLFMLGVGKCPKCVPFLC